MHRTGLVFILPLLVALTPAKTLAIPAVVFEHRALLLRADRTPFCEVEEHYTNHVLDFGPPPQH